jgi:hypothetical protein
VFAAEHRGAAQESEPRVYEAGEPVQVGGLTYRVRKAWWAKFEDGSRGTGLFLGVELALKNSDSRTIQIPPFMLVGSNGREYEPNYSKIVWPKMSVNPGEELSGRIYFHVPRDFTYRLLVSGGYRAKDVAYISLGSVAEGS